MAGAEDEKKQTIPLQDDPDFIELKQVGKELMREIYKVLGSRETTIKLLQQLKKEVEESYDKSRKALIGGTVPSIVGAGLGIAGFGLSFVTFGASLGLAIAGGVLAGAGGVTTAGAAIGYSIVSSCKFKDAETACKCDRETMMKCDLLARKFSEHLDSLSKKHNKSWSDILKQLCTVKNVCSLDIKHTR